MQERLWCEENISKQRNGPHNVRVAWQAVIVQVFRQALVLYWADNYFIYTNFYYDRTYHLDK